MIKYSIAIMGTKPGTPKSQITSCWGHGPLLLYSLGNINSKESWSLRRDSFMLWGHYPARSWGLLRFAQAQAETSKVPKGRETTDGGVNPR